MAPTSRQLQRTLGKSAVYALLIGGAVIFTVPFAWMLVTSLKPIAQTMSMPPTWVPRGPGGEVAPQWHNYTEAIGAMGHFWRYLANTLILCTLTVIGTVSSSAVAAYGFSRIDWPGRNKVFALCLATMMIPFPVVMVPIYSLFRALGMIGTLQPLWIGSFCAGAFNVFLLRQFFLSLPKDMTEAARIDGCNEFQIFLRIIVPLSKPALLVVALFQFMGTWNDFLAPLIYLTDQRDFTLALGLQAFQSQSGGTEWHYLMAASVLIILPVLVLFFFTQKSFIEGISMSGTKG